jgi:hypothetical protein
MKPFFWGGYHKRNGDHCAIVVTALKEHGE